ncbi:MAG: FAD-dependent oxidoreductase [Acetobacteraceae bacterium]|nr:FAD-dependent oxidoreductase [Acetobacteraceae bacterium]
MVAFCKQPEHVQAAVGAARRHGLPLSVRGGGHDWAGRALTDNGFVIDLTGMRDLTVNPLARVTTVAGGALAKDLAVAAGAHNLLAVLGNCGMVGTAGLTLGGGYGPLSGTCGGQPACRRNRPGGRATRPSRSQRGARAVLGVARRRRQFWRRDLPFCPPPSRARDHRRIDYLQLE